MKKHPIVLSILIFLASTVSAQETIDFYKTISSSDDANMISMTTDLFFTQLQSIDGYTISDRRAAPYTTPDANPDNISFFIEIQGNAENGWNCTLHALRLNDSKNLSETKQYSDFYKILLDAKSFLEQLLSSIKTTSADNAAGTEDESSPSLKIQNLDSIAGIWTGEPLVDRVLIMRSGRGFVIFKNGASMNITVSLSNSNLKVVQNGSANASFFPELPRNIALEKAPEADPVWWEMKLTENGHLAGTKHALRLDEATGKAVAGEYKVTWSKK